MHSIFFSPTAHQHLSLIFFHNSHTNGYETVIRFISDLQNLMINYVYFFFFFGEMSLQIFSSYFTQVTVIFIIFILLSCMRTSYVLHSNPLFDTCYKIFLSKYWRCSLTLLIFFPLLCRSKPIWYGLTYKWVPDSFDYCYIVQLEIVQCDTSNLFFFLRMGSYIW